VSAPLFLLAGTAERTGRIVWVGPDDWQYNHPRGLRAFKSRIEANAAKDVDPGTPSELVQLADVLFNGRSATSVSRRCPTLRNVRVVELVKRK
jgi:hypothetical protein